jgi:hypothetical protein
MYLLCINTNAHAIDRHFTNQTAVTIILGAASDEDYEAMYAIACALRNRRDVYMIQEAQADVSGLPQAIKDLGQKAWDESEFGPDVTDGSNKWFNEEENGNYVRENYIPDWAKKKYFKVKIGRHHFYKTEEEL